MIRIDHVVTASSEQLEFVIEGMRNPMNSWDLSDSNYICMENPEWAPSYEVNYRIGKLDEELMHKLSAAGKDHRKYMRMMPVYARITAPLYWWKEFDTYKVGTVSNSCSTMHKIQEHILTLEDFSCDHLSPHSLELLTNQISEINKAIIYFRECKDKEDWWQIIQLLPSSYNQTRNIMMNYEVLANIVASRQSHKLDEWVEFCKWAATLPYAKGIIF